MNKETLFKIQHKNNDTLVLNMPATLDAVNVPEIKTACLEALSGDLTEIQIKLNKTTFMDSAGIGVLIMIYRETKKSGLPLKLVKPTGQPLSLIQSLQIDKVITIG